MRATREPTKQTVQHEYQVLPVFNNTVFAIVAIPFAFSVLLTTIYMHFNPTNAAKVFGSAYLETVNNVIVVIQLLWCGMLIAVSIEAVVKFRATQLPRWVGLDVGRTIFGTMNRIEVVISLLLVALHLYQEILQQQKESLIPGDMTVASFGELIQLSQVVFGNLLNRLNVRFAMNMFPIALIFVQVLYLQPVLDARARQVIVENMNKKYEKMGRAKRIDLDKNEHRGLPANHLFYIAVEISKISLLFWNSVRFMKLI